MPITPEVLKYIPQAQKIKEYCLSNPNEESCGFTLSNGDIYPVKNSHSQPSNDFLIPAEEYSKADEIGITGIFHSHCKDTQAAELSCPDDLDLESKVRISDIESSKMTQIPFILYHTVFDEWDYFDPDLSHPFPIIAESLNLNPQSLDFYKNWRFKFDRSDCLTLFRSYYLNVLGIYIKDYQRPSLDKSGFPPTGWDDYQKFLPEAGFVQVTGKWEKNDILLMRVFSRIPHHVGILVNEKEFLHLLKPGEISKVQYLDEDWKNKVVSVWRHKK